MNVKLKGVPLLYQEDVISLYWVEEDSSVLRSSQFYICACVHNVKYCQEMLWPNCLFNYLSYTLINQLNL